MLRLPDIHRKSARRRTRSAVAALLGAMLALPPGAAAAPDSEPEILAAQASRALRRAVHFLREQVAVHGSYVWKYSPDLTVRKGEGEAGPQQGWVQPPGTPAVGLAFVEAYEATGDGYFLDAARETARALVATQLQSGGWFHWIEFDPDARLAWCYRQPPSGCAGSPASDEARAAFEDNQYRDATTMDDNITQSALTLLIRVDEALGGGDPAIREAAAYGLARLVEAQYPNGAWPDRFDWKVPDALTRSAWRARYPEAWPRRFTPPDDREFYALNDHVVRNAIRVLLLADRVYGRPEYRASARRAGEFLLAAQMPPPQPGWAQLYDHRLIPIWGRKFEPPALASWETGSAIEALLELHLATGEARYLDAVAPAVAWLERVRLADGQWARFYELRTDRPLYMTRDYELTYADDDLPSHYGFKGEFGLSKILGAYRTIAAAGRAAYLAGARAPRDDAALIAELSPEVEALIAAQEPDGRWIDDEMIRSAEVIDHIRTLARYVAAVRGRALTQAHLVP